MGFTNDGPSLACDLDADGDCDGADINLLYAGTPDVPAIDTWLDQASDAANPAKGAANHVYKNGDVELDGDVDSADLGILLNNFGSSNNTFAGGDLNDSGTVDSGDLGILLNNFGYQSPAAAAAVPEPASQSLLLLAVAGMLLAARRK